MTRKKFYIFDCSSTPKCKSHKEQQQQQQQKKKPFKRI